MLNMTDAVGVLTENKRAMWEEILAEFSLRQELYSAILPDYSLKTASVKRQHASLSCRKSNYIGTQQIYLISNHIFFFAVLKAFCWKQRTNESKPQACE